MIKPSIAELEPLRHVLIDACREDPVLHSTLRKMFEKLSNICTTRGWKHPLLVHLPALGAAFAGKLSRTGSIPTTSSSAQHASSMLTEHRDGSRISLSQPAYRASSESTLHAWSTGPLSTLRIQQVTDLKELSKECAYMRPLLRLVLQDCGCLVPDADVKYIKLIYQICMMYKKTVIDCPNERVKDAVFEFISVDRSLRDPHGSWNSDRWVHSRFTFGEDGRSGGYPPEAQLLLDILDGVFYRVMPGAPVQIWDLEPKHGPGAVSDSSGKVDKYDFPAWPNKLDQIFMWERYAFPNDLWSCEANRPSSLEPPARLLAVPKTFKGPRLIASEPTAHQFLQQGLMKWIRENLTFPLRLSIDFLSQVPSQVRAREASQTGALATVDLSAASDRLSCWVVERALGSNPSLLEALHAVRTRCIVDATGVDPDLSLRLKKFAAQGSAVTFPIQTIIYTGCCYAAILYDRGMKVTYKNICKIAREVRVFGDDIILPSSTVPTLTALLHYLELKVNESKTHSTGGFREACGTDAWCGYDITPSYVRHLQLGDRKSVV